MFGISTYIYHKNPPNVGRYTSPMDGMGNWSELFWKLLGATQKNMAVEPGDATLPFGVGCLG